MSTPIRCALIGQRYTALTIHRETWSKIGSG